MVLWGCEKEEQGVEKARCGDKTAAYSLAASLIKQRHSEETLYFPHRSLISMKSVGECKQEIQGFFTDNYAQRREYQAVMRYEGNNYWALETLDVKEP